MIGRWIAYALAKLLLSAAAVLLSPVLALFAVTRASHRYCSAKGPREYLRGGAQLFSTHDDGVDAGWFKSLYDDRAPKGWPQKARDGSRRHRWLLRMWWIARNPSYGFALYKLGFDKGDKPNRRILTQRGAGDTSTTNWLVQVDTNTAGKKAFQVRGQLYFTADRYVDVNLGWKLDWEPALVQVVFSLNPFKVWKEALSQ